MKPRLKFFALQAEWRAWLEENHARVAELWVGFHKKASGKASITWPESVDEALCFGWIDGLRKSVDETSYMIRFTPRRERSTWSAVNIKREGELRKLGVMSKAGLTAFARRENEKSAIYSYEQRKMAKLDAAAARRFRGNAKAWKFFEEQPAGYKRMVSWWVISAKREETRKKRLETLMECCARGKRIDAMESQTKRRTNRKAKKKMPASLD
jgi:uncharacterized protein YdeI (YjbR/CyaY-like superfamily)